MVNPLQTHLARRFEQTTNIFLQESLAALALVCKLRRGPADAAASCPQQGFCAADGEVFLQADQRSFISVYWQKDATRFQRRKVYRGVKESVHKYWADFIPSRYQLMFGETLVTWCMSAELKDARMVILQSLVKLWNGCSGDSPYSASWRNEWQYRSNENFSIYRPVPLWKTSLHLNRVT